MFQIYSRVLLILDCSLRVSGIDKCSCLRNALVQTAGASSGLLYVLAHLFPKRGTVYCEEMSYFIALDVMRVLKFNLSAGLFVSPSSVDNAIDNAYFVFIQFRYNRMVSMWKRWNASGKRTWGAMKRRRATHFRPPYFWFPCSTIPRAQCSRKARLIHVHCLFITDSDDVLERIFVPNLHMRMYRLNFKFLALFWTVCLKGT